jgi:hypothetical protein
VRNVTRGCARHDDKGKRDNIDSSSDYLNRIHDIHSSWLEKYLHSSGMKLNQVSNNSEIYELSPESIEREANKKDIGLALLNEGEAQILRRDAVSHTMSLETEQTILQRSFWTKEKLIDMIFQRIAIFKCVVRDPSGRKVQFPKYLLQADYLASRFAVFDPSPVFRINLTDLGLFAKTQT